MKSAPPLIDFLKGRSLTHEKSIHIPFRVLFQNTPNPQILIGDAQPGVESDPRMRIRKGARLPQVQNTLWKTEGVQLQSAAHCTGKFGGT